MKLEEGPIFGALIIGVGIGYLYYFETGDLLTASLIGLGIIIADYVLVVQIKRRFKK